MPSFDKDQWILEAITARVIVPREDSSIWRRGKIKDGKAIYKRIGFSTHKKTGRIYFQLRFKGLVKSVLVNRVIGLAFLPNPDNLPEVNHVDGVKAHNWKDNLEWSSRSDQEKHAHKTGLKASRGSANANAKLTPAEVQQIRAAPAANHADLAILFKCSKKTIADVIARRTWSHL
jgi:hypothetical protein